MVKRVREVEIAVDGPKCKSVKKIVALGFAGGDSDRIRLNALAKQNYTVTAVGSAYGLWNDYHDYQYSHIEADFATFRGLKDILSAQQPDMIFLDYFWLEPSWYVESRANSYGRLWFDKRGQISQSFERCKDLKYFILPVDAPHRDLPEHKRPESNLLKLLPNSYVADNFHVTIVDRESARASFPFLHADATVNGEIPSERGTCSLQLERYTAAHKAFVLVTRTGAAANELLN